METEEFLINRIRELVGYPDRNLVAAVQQALIDRDTRIAKLAAECRKLSQFLDQFGDVASGEGLRERVGNVIAHYVNQVGRWTSN